MSVATTTTAAGNSTFPQTEAELGGIIVEIEDLDAGNVQVTETTVDTEKEENATVARIDLSEGVAIEEMTITKNYNTTEGDRHLQLRRVNASLDRMTLYTSEVYADQWSTQNQTTYELWTTSPETSSALAGGDLAATDAKFNVHTAGFSEQRINSYGVSDGWYSVSLNASCNGC